MSEERSSTTDSKVLVIGLDGATFDLIKPWAAQGKLPSLARLMGKGISTVLKSTIPPVSAPAWISFMTGKNPGRHGVLLFQMLDLSRYDYYGDETFVNSTFYAGETIFDILSIAGRRLISIAVPVTYPPFAVNGLMVAGFPCPRRGYTFPPELAERLGKWHSSLPCYREVSSEDRKIEDANALVEKRTSVCIDLMNEEDWDLFVFVLQNTDAIAHNFWRYMDSTHPDYHSERGREYRHAILNAYQKADEAIGRLLRHVPEKTMVFVMSDHGMTRAPSKLVHTNYWLHTLGLLAIRESGGLRSADLSRYLDILKRYLGRPLKGLLQRHLPRKMLRKIIEQNLNIGNIDWERTQAYRVRMFWSVEGIEINLKARQPCGTVKPGQEYENLRDRIIEGAMKLRDPATGEPIVEAAYRKEELYVGKHLANIPDIIVIYRSDYAGGARLRPPLVEQPRRMHAYSRGWSGSHDGNGILILHGKDVRRGGAIQSAEIVDIAPTILYALGIPVPSDMDGRVLTAAFEESFVASNPIQWSGPISESEELASRLTRQEEQSIRDHLKELGYLD